MGWLIGFLARSALMSSPFGAFLKGGWGVLQRIPKPVWEVLAVLGYALALAALHQHYAHAAIKAADQGGYARARQEDAAALAKLRAAAQAVTANGAKIAQETRTANDAENRNIHSAADTLRVRGPGASGCRRIGDPAVPAASGGHEPANRPGDAAIPDMPVADGASFLAMPWDQAVAYGEQHDSFRAEALSWRDWYQRQSKAWEALKNGAQPVSK